MDTGTVSSVRLFIVFNLNLIPMFSFLTFNYTHVITINILLLSKLVILILLSLSMELLIFQGQTKLSVCIQLRILPPQLWLGLAAGRTLLNVDN